MNLNDLKPARGSRRSRKRVGRGIAAGQGKTSGRGQKGQGARSSFGLPRAFEGGQLPLTQRLPKLRGFHNKWRREYAIVNIGKLGRFEKNAVVDIPALVRVGLIAPRTDRVKLLGAGDVKLPLHLRVHRVSESARRAIERAGGKVELLDTPERSKSANTPAAATVPASGTETESEEPGAGT